MSVRHSEYAIEWGGRERGAYRHTGRYTAVQVPLYAPAAGIYRYTGSLRAAAGIRVPLYGQLQLALRLSNDMIPEKGETCGTLGVHMNMSMHMHVHGCSCGCACAMCKCMLMLMLMLMLALVLMCMCMCMCMCMLSWDRVLMSMFVRTLRTLHTLRTPRVHTPWLHMPHASCHLPCYCHATAMLLLCYCYATAMHMRSCARLRTSRRIGRGSSWPG